MWLLLTLKSYIEKNIPNYSFCVCSFVFAFFSVLFKEERLYMIQKSERIALNNAAVILKYDGISTCHFVEIFNVIFLFTPLSFLIYLKSLYCFTIVCKWLIKVTSNIQKVIYTPLINLGP